MFELNMKETFYIKKTNIEMCHLTAKYYKMYLEMNFSIWSF